MKKMSSLLFVLAPGESGLRGGSDISFAMSFTKAKAKARTYP